jgi:threonine/homoserine/homoserine lactone efflux protein
MLALLLAAAIVMGSPGPSTASVTAVGAAFGFRRSLGYTAGLIAGTSAVLLAVAAGVVAALLTIPHAEPVLMTASAIYILWLAWRIANAPPLFEDRRHGRGAALRERLPAGDRQSQGLGGDRRGVRRVTSAAAAQDCRTGRDDRPDSRRLAAGQRVAGEALP